MRCPAPVRRSDPPVHRSNGRTMQCLARLEHSTMRWSRLRRAERAVRRRPATSDHGANRHLRQHNHGWPARLGGICATCIGIRLLRSRARPRVLYDHRRRWWSGRMCRVRHARGGSASRHHRVVPRTVRYTVRDRRAIRAGPGKSAGWFMERARRGYRSEHLHSSGRRRLHSHLCCVQQVLRGVCIPTDLGDRRGGDRSTAQRSDLYQ